ncbi:MAG: MraY family glycosyltransferase [Candidatus Komeilibacteria bacterium]|nr:MraY family glycosyltransferase [Candidatus Komeilibacteria bacterium]
MLISLVITRSWGFWPAIFFKELLILGLASTWLLIGGLLDDKLKFSPFQQIIWPILAVVTVLMGGLTVSFVTNPVGGVILVPPALGLIIITLWLLGTVYTCKFLDGVDGLVSGLGVIGSLILFVVSLSWDKPLALTSFASISLAGACLGFWFWNKPAAKIFLGESGSTLIGFWLGSLAVLSGAKIATALLIMALPIMDAAWVIIRRLKLGRSPFKGDREHLHFQLIDKGLSAKQTIILVYCLALLFGSVALWQETIGKIIALVIVLGIVIYVEQWARKKS